VTYELLALSILLGGLAPKIFIFFPVVFWCFNPIRVSLSRIVFFMGDFNKVIVVGSDFFSKTNPTNCPDIAATNRKMLDQERLGLLSWAWAKAG